MPGKSVMELLEDLAARDALMPVIIITGHGELPMAVRAIKGGPEATSNFKDYAGPLTETILLGNLAVWDGGRIEWDPKNLKVTNKPDDALASIVRATYRQGYEIPS